MDILSHGYSTTLTAGQTAPDVARLREELGGFELGRYLLNNLGLNGLWTSYVLLYPERGSRTRLSSDGTPLGDLEAWLLDRCPILLATQQRFRLMRGLTQPLLRSGMQLASLPSGLMDDLLTLDYAASEGVSLTAIDLDAEALDAALRNHRERQSPVAIACEQRDAWQLGCQGRWDLITSNGLNIYVDDDELCTAFYRQVAEALRPEGMFLVSFITPPDHWQPYSRADLEQQRLLFEDVVPVRWMCHRDESTTRGQLAEAGLEVISVHYDEQRMFPAVLARKRGSALL
jgi:SAM-dependent methyltransferase